MMIEITDTVRAPAALVRSVYADYSNWPRVFPLIIRATLRARQGTTAVLEVDRVGSQVITELTVEREQIVLREQMKRYEVTLVTRLVPAADHTTILVSAQVQLTGATRLLGPLLSSVARRQISRWQLRPLINACESRLPTILPPAPEPPSNRSTPQAAA